MSQHQGPEAVTVDEVPVDSSNTENGEVELEDISEDIRSFTEGAHE